MKVLVKGMISVYEAGGTYQIYVSEMMEDGIGDLYKKYELLKRQLEQEGLFDTKYKKPIPRFPKKIGIVTASTGAAIKDILSTIKRRYPICATYLFPCLVQGENAHIDIVNKIKEADSYNCDVLIVGRGGGSFEDLNCFNAEDVARTIFACKTPVISAVGHEIDFTIADFVADLRAPTPTGAAEMAVPNYMDLIRLVNQYKIRLNESVLKKVKYMSLEMETIKNSFVIKNPNLMFENRRQTLDLKQDKLKEIIKHTLDMKKNNLLLIKKHYILNNPEVLIEKQKLSLKTNLEKLELLNPLSILKRGYSITYKDNIALKDIKDVKINDKIEVKLTNGIIKANVWEVNHE
jgi:exodeoxyribonuclease VII large subunit